MYYGSGYVSSFLFLCQSAVIAELPWSSLFKTFFKIVSKNLLFSNSLFIPHLSSCQNDTILKSALRPAQSLVQIGTEFNSVSLPHWVLYALMALCFGTGTLYIYLISLVLIMYTPCTLRVNCNFVIQYNY